MIRKIWNDFLGLFFPNTCAVCGTALIEGEETICLLCRVKIPKTNFHSDRDNKVERRFFGKLPLVEASSFFHFSKGNKYRHLIHLLKYKDRQDVGVYLGKLAGIDLLKAGTFSDIDCIIPIPLHPKKERKRGYNQAECIAIGLSEVLQKPVETKGVRRTKANVTQTKKNVIQRWKNVQEIFELNDVSRIEGKHILLVDDVLTTGATMEACAKIILQADGVKISLFTLAVA